MLSSSKARTRCAAFLRDIDAAPATLVIPASESLFQSGLSLYEQRPDKEWSLTDCISFLVMAEEDLVEALTGDHHFEQAGFTTLLA